MEVAARCQYSAYFAHDLLGVPDVFQNGITLNTLECI